MLAVQGYYDGTAIQLLEKITAKPNQRVIITVMDDFIEDHEEDLSQGYTPTCGSGGHLLPRYIDLVFYNYILKCFVLIDLKTSKLTHQDVGQMDMYIRMPFRMPNLPVLRQWHESSKIL